MCPKVAIVIVSWNKKNYVINLLNSLQKINYENYDIIVVDNASTDCSVEAIKKQFHDIHVIVNSENLGGTGGFNTGMRYALEKEKYKYIWLLDNDADVRKDALYELVKTMEENNRIGIAGSRVVDTVSKNITVEAGAFFRWDTIEVEPLFRNEKDINFKNTVEDVDYVAICSALVRTDALKKIGLMDERYFIFWDDMDWGLQFKKSGFRVVAVLSSIVYHPAFTEKRSALIDYYYGNRNALLTYAKHTNYLKRLFIFLNYLRYCLKAFIFLGLSGRKDLMSLGFKSLYDFITDKWGRKKPDNINQKVKDVSCNFPKDINKIIILNGGNRDEIYETLKKLKTLFSKATYTLLIEDDRAEMFENDFQNIIKLNRNKKYKLQYSLSIFFKILLSNYHVAVNPKYPSPFSFAVKRSYCYNPTTGKIQEDKNSLRNIWKLIISTICGEVLTIFLLPVVYISSLKYGKQFHNKTL